ncbi:response regulator [Vibrio anguillarum]|uniref:response regulator n=1 Tax=Vibrio anguillarum TaxID=55601 RepID=UPI000B53F285|nr:response regulator [Vibrio anguillarum]ASG03213.1 response regulator [Vibrio anguillarum]
MKILIIEDDDYKVEHLEEYLRELYLNIQIDKAFSVKGAKKLISNFSGDAVLLDMTLPTYDISKESSGGRPQGFGGIEVLRFMEMIESETPVIIVTQFQSFEIKDNNKEVTRDISYLKELLEEEDFVNFKGIVQFSSSTEKWKDDLKEFLDKIE